MWLERSMLASLSRCLPESRGYRETGCRLSRVMSKANSCQSNIFAGESVLISNTAHMPQMPRQLDTPIGCIGSGFIMADCHLVAYKSAGFNPVAIASRTPAKAQSVAQRHNLTAYTTYQEMLSEADIEVVDVAVPPDVQLQVIREIVKHAGKIKGVLAQKPLGVNYKQATEIVTLCEEAGIVLSVNLSLIHI